MFAPSAGSAPPWFTQSPEKINEGAPAPMVRLSNFGNEHEHENENENEPSTGPSARRALRMPQWSFTREV